MSRFCVYYFYYTGHSIVWLYMTWLYPRLIWETLSYPGLPHSHPLEQTSKVEGRRDVNASSQATAQTLPLSWEKHMKMWETLRNHGQNGASTTSEYGFNIALIGRSWDAGHDQRWLGKSSIFGWRICPKLHELVPYTIAGATSRRYLFLP